MREPRSTSWRASSDGHGESNCRSRGGGVALAARHPGSTWGRIYRATWVRALAALYDRAQAAQERAGVRERRRRLLADAKGRTIEIGAGTGLNLDHYRGAVTELVLTEPDRHMAGRLRRKLDSGPGVPGDGPRETSFVAAPAERLPFDDDSFDCAVVTLVLCTVPDPAAALAEISRVLRPDGRMLFMEHVRSRDPRLARWQDRLRGPWRFIAAGCNCNRDTLATITASPLTVGRVEHGRLPKVPPIVRPVIVGSATNAAR